MSIKKHIGFASELKEYCRLSTIQGLNHIVAPNRHIVERALWALIVVLSCVASGALIVSSLNRYRNEPTVISLDKDYRHWETPLPASTICFQNKFDANKARKVIKRIWNVTNGARYKYLREFLYCLSNANYKTLQNCSPFSTDESLKEMHLTSLISDVNFDMKSIVGAFHDESIPLAFHQTFTEMGACYAVDFSLLTRYFYVGQKRVNISRSVVNPMCSLYKPLCYANTQNYNRAISFYVHSAYELPQVTSMDHFALEQIADASYNVLTMESTTRVRKLRPSQRKCIFFDEKPTGESPFYTYALCRFNCRRELSIKLCGCVPFFYVERENQPHCTILDIPCLIKHADLLESLMHQSNKTKYDCGCLASCSSTSYYQTALYIKPKMMFNSKANTSGYVWRMESMPRMKLKRDVLFNSEDLLVAWGGIAGLFLGCSVISGIELIYFLTIRFFRVIFCSLNQTPPFSTEITGNMRRPRKVIYPYKDYRALRKPIDLSIRLLE